MANTPPHTPPNRRRNHVNSQPDFFQNPMLLVVFPHVARVSLLHKLLACVLKPHLSPG